MVLLVLHGILVYSCIAILQKLITNTKQQSEQTRKRWEEETVGDAIKKVRSSKIANFLIWFNKCFVNPI